MDKIIFLVTIEPPEMRVIELRGAKVFDFYLERDGRLLGDIYKGQVETVLPGMDAAFVNIGLNRNALIYAGDIGAVDRTADKPHVLPIENLIRAGDEIVVQIARPPVGKKGARVTTRISIPGRYTVLTAQADNVGISRRIESDEERSRLRRIADKLRPLDHGLIVRTEAENIADAELTSDVAMLARQLHDIIGRAAKVQAPFLLHRDLGLLGRLARDRLSDNVDAIYIDSEEVFEAFQDFVRQLAPQYVERVFYTPDIHSVAGHIDIDREIARATERVVVLPSGGCLVIDEAEALTAIDVNTSKFVGKSRLADTVLQTNLEAVEEATRQLRLRDIGGVIVIDLIDMERTRDRIKVMNTLEAALKHDRTRIRIVQLSPLGLVEMTRRREGYSLRQTMQRSCPYCSGDGSIRTAITIALETRRAVRQAARSSSGAAFQVTLHPEVAAAFIGADAEYIQQLEHAIGVPIFLRVDFNLHLEASRLEIGPVATFTDKLPNIAPGARLHLPPQSPLYPEAAPQFAVLNNMLVLLQEENETGQGRSQPEPPHPAIIEIIERGHWFLAAKVLVRQPAQSVPPSS